MDQEKYWLMRGLILRCLDSRGKWGGAHTSIKRMLAKISRDQRGSKEAKLAVCDLIKEGKIMIKKTLEDDHVSLNPRMLKEIREEELKNDYSKKEY